MNGGPGHWTIVPIALPLVAGAAMLLLGESRRRARAAIGLGSALALLAVAAFLLRSAGGPEGEIAIYLPGNWPPPFGIALAVDRLSAVMLTLTALLAVASLVFSLGRWDRAGVHFQPLFQFQLMGLNGAFMTADLFNLFVFFEVLLVASYGLALHGSGTGRVRASLHYIAVNLAASFTFLIGVSLIYGAAGTLNLADLALRIPALDDHRRTLFDAGAAVLALTFLVKAAAWPLNFWLPRLYAVSAAPVAALFAIMTKVGIYALLRIWSVMFGGASGPTPWFGLDWLLAIGLATATLGAMGLLASQHLGRQVAYSVIVTSGTLLAAFGLGREAVMGPALFYLVSSTLAAGAFFLVVELVERNRSFGADMLAITFEAFELGDEQDPDRPDEVVGVAIPMATAFLGLSFVTCALLVAGLPPLSGFLAKFAMLSALLGPVQTATATTGSWLLLAVVILSGLAGVVAFARSGIRGFWASDRGVPRLALAEAAPVVALLLLCAVLAVQAGPVMRYLDDAARALYRPQQYIDAMSAVAVPDRPPGGGTP